jgi:Transmembrane protein 254
MQRSKPALALCEVIEIAERDWLTCGLLWIAIGTLALSPFAIVARVGRVLFAFTLCVHTVEAAYVAFRARMVGLSAQKWFLRTIVLGSLALLTMEFHLRKVPRPRSLR